MGGIYYHYCYGPPQPLAYYSMSRIMMVNNHEGFLPYDEVDGLPGQVARCLSCLEKCLKVPPFLAQFLEETEYFAAKLMLSMSLD